MSDSISDFRNLYQAEHERTRKVLEAFPADQAEFKPHERSSSALKLLQTFVVEQNLLLRAVRNEQVVGSGGFGAVPKSWNEALEALETQHREIMERLETLKDGELQTVQFMTGPGKMGDFEPLHFLRFMLFDQIHHRGQLSVYVRMAGGKVPAIYGPSGDEPWN
ncbi:MAG TPA: DinB family protein [Thermoanaerobaculia bacterium]|nr:DinB family protein [Thermoanaerobaculia bacterium]